MSQPELAAGRELDALVAERVMGWRSIGSDGISTFGDPPNDPLDLSGTGDGHFHVPRYSTDISAAWEVVEKAKDWRITIDGGEYHGDSWGVKIANNDGYFYGFGDTAPLAICRAALAAVGAS